MIELFKEERKKFLKETRKIQFNSYTSLKKKDMVQEIQLKMKINKIMQDLKVEIKVINKI